MPIIKCEECLGQVSDQAFECPQCGVPIRNRPAPKDKENWFERAFYIVAIVVCIFVFRAVDCEDAAPLSAGIAGAFRPSEELLNSSYEIDEGEYVYHSFELLTDVRLQVEVNSRPEPVDVMLMTPADFEKYRRASEEGGSYTYRDLLSRKQVVQFDETETLLSGEWTIVVARPIEDIESPQSTAADITITLH